MFSFQQDIDVPADRRVVIELPPEVPLGLVKLEITIASEGEAASGKEKTAKRSRTSLSEWAKENAEDWGDEIKSTDVEGFTGRRF